MLTALYLGNFKAFAETQEIPIRPITLIFGANSSGKSSIIHSLLLAQQGMETDDYDVGQPEFSGELVDLGGFENYVHKHDCSRSVTLGFTIQADSQELASHLDGEEEEKRPFLKPLEFGLELNLGPPELQFPQELITRSIRKVLWQNAPWVKQIGISFDRHPALELCEPLLKNFSAHQVSPQSPFLTGLLEHMARLSSAFEVKKERTRHALSGDLALHDAPNTHAESDAKSVAGNIDVGALNEAFSKVLAEREFYYEKSRLCDIGPNDEWGYTGWRDELDYEGTFGFFLEHGKNYDRAREWSEAQAIRHNLSKFLEFYTTQVATVLNNIRYLGPIRHVPPRNSSGQAAAGSKSVACGHDAWESACRSPQILETVNKWLGPEHLRTPYRLKVRHLIDANRLSTSLKEKSDQKQTSAVSGAEMEDVIQRLSGDSDLAELFFVDLPSGTSLTHRDIGFGVSQVLPVLVNACVLKERLIAIEQPELHLHPAQQAELGDVFIESALGDRKNTFVLETHSEHLILRIMRRIRETYSGKLPEHLPPIKPSDVSIQFVEKDGNRSIVRSFPLNERGELVKAWPGGFFEEGLKELL